MSRVHCPPVTNRITSVTIVMCGTQTATTDLVTALGKYAAAAPPAHETHPKEVAHIRAVQVLGPKRGRWK